MTVFLTSSPCVNGADRAILNPVNDFVERLQEAIPTQARCLFVCSAPNSYDLTDRFGGDMEEAFREAGLDFSDFAVLDGRNAREAAELIAWSDVIILAGGHVPTQNAFFREISLAELLRDYPGVIIGISAGSMNSAETVYAHPEEEGEAVDPDYQRFLPGFGLTFLNILPHFQQWKDDTLDGQRLLEDIAFGDSYGHSFLILVDGSYVWIRDGRTEILGEAYCLEDGNMEQIGQEGDCLVL